MPEVAVYAPGTVSWVDLASKDLEKSKAFYSKLFGWQAQTIEDPQAGGYTMFLINGKQASALGPNQDEQQPPSAWSIYFATEDAKKTAQAVKDAGGKVIAEPMDVMGQGVMAVFQDPTGAFFSVWQPGIHKGFEVPPGQPSTYAWAELIVCRNDNPHATQTSKLARRVARELKQAGWQLERVLCVYVRHYNEQRPHRALDLSAPNPRAIASTRGDPMPTAVRRRDLLGGLIHEYEAAA